MKPSPLAGLILGVVHAFGAEPDALPQASNADRISPYAANPRYWQYRGQPVVLLGGSKDDNLFQIPDLREHLEEMAAAGANYIRNTMSDRPDKGFEVYPFLRREDGKYDLERWNPEYWRRFANLLREAHSREIVVQIEIWDRFDYSGANWEKHPYNPANNVTYTFEQSGLSARYPDHPGANRQPFFFSTPAQRNNRILLPIQQRFVDELLRHTLPYPNILYCMDNETSAEPAWGAYWASYLRQRARAENRDVFLTEMWDDWNLRSAQHRATLDHPELYDFADVSQNNHQRGQTHWDNFLWVCEYLGRQRRPLNTVKTYGADGGRFGSTRDGIERWWRHLIGGAAAVRFHRPDSGLGLGPEAAASIRAARQLAALCPPWASAPAQHLLRDREPNEAYLSANPGTAYALYFPAGGRVEIDLGGHDAEFTLRWIRIATGEFGPQTNLHGGDWRRLEAPENKHWAAALIRQP